jgi:hypothetical protein
MSTQNIAPAHRGLADIDVVEPLSDADRDCFNDLREVLKKHNALSRFGVSLLHRHFDVYDDEVLVEFCDKDRRTLTLTPTKVTALGELQLKQTNWRLDVKQSMSECTTACVSYCPTQNSEHVGSIHDSKHY